MEAGLAFAFGCRTKQNVLGHALEKSLPATLAASIEGFKAVFASISFACNGQHAHAKQRSFHFACQMRESRARQHALRRPRRNSCTGNANALITIHCFLFTRDALETRVFRASARLSVLARPSDFCCCVSPFP